MSPDVVGLVVAAVLVVLAGLAVAAETAFGRVSRARIDELQREGVAGAERLRPLLEDRARYVNVLLFTHMALYVAAIVLVTRASLVLVIGPIWWQLLAAALVMLVIGYVALGVAPRTLGVQHADRIAMRSAPVARALATVLSPFATLLILVGNALIFSCDGASDPFIAALDKTTGDLLWRQPRGRRRPRPCSSVST